MRESQFQAHLIKRIPEMLPGAVVLKNDANYIQGFPDLTVLYYYRWGVLEVKASATAPVQPNQAYYIEELGKLAFAAFIFPENEEEILHALQSALRP